MDAATQTRKAPAEALRAPVARAFDLARDAVNVDARTVELAFSSEEPYERWFGIEVLSHEKGACRLGRLAGGGALLMDHNTRDQIGVVEKVEIGTDRVGRATVRFGESARAEEIFRDVQTGIRRHVSVGYMVHRWEVKEGSGDAASTYTALDWEPLEVSIVSVPADPTVGIGRGLSDEQSQHLARTFGFEQLPAAEGVAARAHPAPTVPVQPKESKMDKTPEQIAQERDAAAAAARADTTKSVQAIMDLGTKYKHLGGESHAAEYIRSGKTDAAEFQGVLLAKIGTAGSDTSRGEIGMTPKEVKQFSFLRAMAYLADPMDSEAREAAAFERECSGEARKRAGNPKRGAGITIPMDVLRASLQQRDLTVGSATAGGNLVATNLLAGSFIDLLRKAMVTQRLGATTLNGLVGNIAIPRQSGAATAYWVAESGSPTEGAQTVDQVTMSPKTVGAYTDFSRKLILQSSIDVEMMVRNDLAKVIALEIDRAALYGSGSSNQPTGVKNQSGINTVDFAAAGPTWAEVVSLETECAADNADVGTLAYAVNATGRGTLKTTDKASGAGQFVWEPGNTVNGYRTEVSNQVASGDYWFGNWADLLIGFWSGLDLLVDPYTGSTSGTVRVVTLQDCDIAVRHPESFCRGNNTL
jgi:HK97 family phage major capsid protein